MGSRGRPLFDLNEPPTEDNDERDGAFCSQPQMTQPSTNSTAPDLLVASTTAQGIMNNHAFSHASTVSGFQPFIRPKSVCVPNTNDELKKARYEDTKAMDSRISSSANAQSTEREEGEWSDEEGFADVNRGNNLPEQNKASHEQATSAMVDGSTAVAYDSKSSNIKSSNNIDDVKSSRASIGLESDCSEQKHNGTPNSESSIKSEASIDAQEEPNLVPKQKEVKGIEATHALRCANNPGKRKIDQRKEEMLGKKRNRQTMFLNLEDVKQAGPIKTSTPRRQTFASPVISRTIKEIRTIPAQVERVGLTKDQKQIDSSSGDGATQAEAHEPKSDSNGDNSGSFGRSRRISSETELPTEVNLPPIPRQGSWKQQTDLRQQKNALPSSRKLGQSGQTSNDVKLGNKKHLSIKKQAPVGFQSQDTSVERLIREVTSEKFWHQPGEMTSHSDESAHDSGRESDDSGHDSGRETHRREITVMKELIGRGNKGLPKLIVEWNVKNQAIGDNGRKLKSFCGVRARMDIPITIKNWNHKNNAPLKKAKDEIWLMIQKYFDLDDSRKDFCLMKAGKAHRKFRSTLTKWMTDKEGNIKNRPPSAYREIIQLEDWRAFVLSRQAEEFKKLSRANSERASNPEFPYRAGVKGYSDIEELRLREEGRDPTHESLDRHILWLEARYNKDGVVEDPKTKEVLERIEALSQSASQGELTDCDGPNDLLAQALAIKEYPGRLRGVGSGVSQTNYWSSFASKRQKREEKRKKEEERERREKQMEAMILKLQSELDELKQKVCPPIDDLEASPNPNSFRSSCNIASNEVNNCHCELYSSNLTLVAKGFLCNTEDSTLHNLPMPSNHVRVKIDFVVVDNAELPVPIDTPDFSLFTVNDALGTLVAWPSNLINVKKARSQSQPSIGRKKNVPRRESSGNEIQSQPSIARKDHVSRQQASGKEIQSQPSPSIARKNDVQMQSQPLLYDQFISYIMIHATQMTDLDVIRVTMDSDILGLDDQIELRKDELAEVSGHEWASVSTIQTYMRYLYYNIMIPNQQAQRFFFLCPLRTFMINPIFKDSMTKEQVAKLKQRAKENKDEAKAYIDRRFTLARGRDHDVLFLAPFNLGHHWILLVIDPKRNRVFYLDSCHGEPSNHLKMKGVFESCLTTYWGSNEARPRDGSKGTKWKRIKCPRQPKNNDCGYYVMRFMKDILTHSQMEIPQNYFPYKIGGAPFSVDELTEIKGEWCQYVSNLIAENRNFG